MRESSHQTVMVCAYVDHTLRWNRWTIHEDWKTTVFKKGTPPYYGLVWSTCSQWHNVLITLHIGFYVYMYSLQPALSTHLALVQLQAIPPQRTQSTDWYPTKHTYLLTCWFKTIIFREKGAKQLESCTALSLWLSNTDRSTLKEHGWRMAQRKARIYMLFFFSFLLTLPSTEVRQPAQIHLCK